MMEGFVPIIEISDENIVLMWPALYKAIQEALFIAIDCELSGLGNRSKINFPEVDIRYKNTAKIAQEYSIVSLGLSCYKCNSISALNVNDSDSCHVQSQNYFVQTFNILTLCKDPYIVESASLKFLASHGFDFNRQYKHGLMYTRQKENQDEKNSYPSVKDIFTTILKYQKPIVFHNGYIDIIHLYQSFYAPLPKKCDTFAADLNEMFPNGIYDTKYIVEFHDSMPATFLEYVFKNVQLKNRKRSENGEWHVRLSFPPYPETLNGLDWHPYQQIYNRRHDDSDHSRTLCNDYKYHGFCQLADKCRFSHDIDRVVHELEPKKKKRQKHAHMAAVSTISALKNFMESRTKIKESRRRIRTRKHNGSFDRKLNNETDSAENSLGMEQKSTGYVQNGYDVRTDESYLSDSGDEMELDPSPINEEGNYINIGSSENDIGSSAYSNNEKDHKENSFILNHISTNNPTNTSFVNSSSFKTFTNNSQVKNCNLNSSDNCDVTNSFDNCDVTNSSDNCDVTNSSKDRVDFTSKINVSDYNVTKSNNCSVSGHRAGFDAFMTGYIFACALTIYANLNDPKQIIENRGGQTDHLVNQIYLIGKSFPFLVRKSSYSKTSRDHTQFIAKL